jgi:DNA-binding transcriptional LysR family regulator
MRLNGSDITSLNVFRVVAEHGSFVRAQYSLNMSQSSVSQHIVKLEEKLGFKLCSRGRAGFALTEKGEEINKYACALFRQIDEFSDILGEVRNELTGQLRIGISDNIVNDPHLPLSVALRRFLDKAKMVDVRLDISSHVDIEAKLLSGTLDVALIPAYVEDAKLRREKVYEEQQILCCAEEHPLFEEENVSLEMIESHDFVVRPYRDIQELKIFQRAKVAATASNMEAIAIFVLTGRFLGYLPENYARSWLASGKMRTLRSKETSFGVNFFVMTRKDGGESLLLQAFLSELRDVLHDAKPPLG